MKTKDFSIILLITAGLAFGYAKYREKYSPKNAKEACDRGDTPSCRIHAGLAKQAGNTEEAKRYYQIACDRKDSHACYFLSNLSRLEEVGAVTITAPSLDGQEQSPAAPPPGCSATDTPGCSAPTAEQPAE